MNNNIEIFKNEIFGEVRTLNTGNEILFCASDVAKMLGYSRPNDAINQHCRATVKHSTLISGKKQEINFIKEGDIYRLIIKSRLPQAEQFEKWIFEEVLPSIRKHGLYAMNELLENPDMLINALQKLKEEKIKTKQLEDKIKIKDQQILELQPKASYYDIILQCKDSITITTIAKDYGISALKLNNILHDLGIQFKQNGVWLLYQKYASMGYTLTKTHNYTDSKGLNHAKIHTYWTQKGRLFLYELLKKHEILPIIEKENNV